VTDPELGKFPLLAQLGEADRAAVVDELDLSECAAGTTLFREGDPADGALFVAQGRVRVHTARVAAEGEFGAGDVLGTLSLVVDGPREATAETLSNARIWRLSRDAYRRLAALEPGTACHLLEGILREYAGAVREEVRRDSSASMESAPVDPAKASD
jgi:CRP-like cAMP-binding protein